MADAKHRVNIYTDGSCAPTNPGFGGWAYIRVENEVASHVVTGSEPDSTNNRMELMAAIEALKASEPFENLCIFTDSQYVRQGILTWVAQWKQKGWTRKGGAVKNLDLWKLLDSEAGRRNVEWMWVKAHSGDQYNELVDQAAREAALLLSRGGHPRLGEAITRNSPQRKNPSQISISLCFASEQAKSENSTVAWASSTSRGGLSTSSYAIQRDASYLSCVLTAAIECLASIQTNESVHLLTNSFFLQESLQEDFEVSKFERQARKDSEVLSLREELMSEVSRLRLTTEYAQDDSLSTKGGLLNLKTLLDQEKGRLHGMSA